MTQTFSDGTFSWDVSKLWELSKDFEVEEMPLAELEDQLDDDCWGVSPREMLSVITQHYLRAKGADMSYPILLTPDGYVCDGMHRLLRAYMEVHETVKVKKFEEWSEMHYARIDK